MQISAHRCLLGEWAEGYRQSLEERERHGGHARATAPAWIHSRGVKRAPWLGRHSHAQRVPQPVLQPVPLVHLPFTPAPVRLSHPRSVPSLRNALSPTLNVPIYPSFKIHMLPDS